jgi:mannose/fructose/sorbose-specific phosphotransferase system IIA component
MVSIIICTHGEMGIEIKKSMEMIFGKTESIFPISFQPGENTDDLISKMENVISEHQLTEVLAFVDLVGGSPYNAASTVAMKGKVDIDVVAGVNLPLCLEAITSQSLSLTEMIDHLRSVAPETIKIFSDLQVEFEEEELE